MQESRFIKCQATTVQELSRVATLRPRSGAMAGKRHPASEVRGSQEKPRRTLRNLSDPEELPGARGQGQQLGGTTHA
jgi:hypothetical protein